MKMGARKVYQECETSKVPGQLPRLSPVENLGKQAKSCLAAVPRGPRAGILTPLSLSVMGQGLPLGMSFPVTSGSPVLVRSANGAPAS